MISIYKQILTNPQRNKKKAQRKAKDGNDEMVNMEVGRHNEKGHKRETRQSIRKYTILFLKLLTTQNCCKKRYRSKR